MSTFTMVVWIVAIGCAYGIVAKWLELRAEKRSDNEDSETTLAKLDALEERIRVLERIVTEQKFDLKREINRL